MKPISSQPVQTRENNSEEAILEEARERAAIALFGWKETFKNSREDEAFIAGAQWDAEALRDRELDGRPALVINQLQQYISRIAGAQKKQVQEIKISPVESNSQEELSIKTIGNNDVKVSKVLEGVVRNIQSVSNATAHYKTAFRHGLTGIGWLRVLTGYSRQDSFELDIKIEAIRDRLSVLIDPSAKESDYSDADYCFIHERISHEEFYKRYPGKKIGSLDETSDTRFWGDDKTITVSEYFRREPVTRTLCLLSSGETVYKDDVKDIMDELADKGIYIARERKVRTYKIIWSKITANDILESDREFQTSTIPVIPVLGREAIINERRIYQGAVTHAKDPQTMLNFWQSAATERISLAPKSPYVGEAESIEGYEAMWKTANVKNYSFLPYKKGFQPPRREAPPSMPMAEMQMSQTMQQNIQSSIGIYDASLGKAGNETSGRAILARQSESDTGSFEFIDNLTNAMRRVGILLVELIPKVYDTERILRIKNPDGSGDFVEINKVVTDEQTGEDIIVNDLAMGKYDVVVTTGASYATKRIETADSMLQFAQAVPQVASVAADLIAENMDFNNSDAIAERLKKSLPPQILSKEDQEELMKDQPAPQPDPNLVMQQQMAQMKTDQEKLKTQQEQLQTQQEKIKLEKEKLEYQKEQEELMANTITDRINAKNQAVGNIVNTMKGGR